MIGIFTLIIWFVVLLFVSKLTYTLHHKIKKAKADEDDQLIKKIAKKQNIVYTLIVILSVLGAGIIYYFFLKNTIYEGHFFEWINLIVRWMHITFGIAWIGASFYFVFLENALNQNQRC